MKNLNTKLIISCGLVMLVISLISSQCASENKANDDDNNTAHEWRGSKYDKPNVYGGPKKYNADRYNGDDNGETDEAAAALFYESEEEEEFVKDELANKHSKEARKNNSKSTEPQKNTLEQFDTDSTENSINDPTQVDPSVSVGEALPGNNKSGNQVGADPKQQKRKSNIVTRTSKKLIQALSPSAEKSKEKDK